MIGIRNSKKTAVLEHLDLLFGPVMERGLFPAFCVSFPGELLALLE
jgi:hypothetical protein